MSFSTSQYLDDRLYSGSSGSSNFGLSNSYTLPLTGGVSGSAGDTPLWAQIFGGLGQIGSLIDPYILTEQEKLEYQFRLAQAQAEAAKAQAASVQAQPVVPVWVWVLVGLGVVLLVVLALKE
ncbi:hypothetical protein CSW35_07915 [Thermus scotoductus]|uniref:Uncharacterized protein n=1 Tax=Thermus scotoductus TaxID=37636 RepID=A0A430SCU2_THESC|nr:hypothetical protein CSW48_02305 [Thermus scotoductus]RTH10004.1 hypothetical protein CSW44_07680 [Thermus scotoductus]RTH11052.1 hypothetical protein CSW43_07320 [Thermus scotoductus]RTH12467.1 hypothetical protein CSW46_02040 [Thermus scotoductus]RTH17993.1 hypothetical protein CSW39_06180 [Thermus scotoductus]